MLKLHLRHGPFPDFISLPPVHISGSGSVPVVVLIADNKSFKLPLFAVPAVKCCIKNNVVVSI